MDEKRVRWAWQAVAIGLTAYLFVQASETSRLEAEVKRLHVLNETERCKPTAKIETPPTATGRSAEELAPPQPSPLPSTLPAAVPTVAEDDSQSKEQAFAVRAKISNIEKFVPLTDDTRTRLERKFETEVTDRSATTETLEDILGAEQANFYRAEVKKTFLKVRDEEVEKEVLLLGRNLALSSDQQRMLRDTYIGVEQQLDALYGDPEARYRFKGTMEERMKRMVEASRYRRDQLASALKGILTAEQYEAYLKEAESSAEGDFTVWHQ